MQLYNTRSLRKEEFVPRDPPIRIYVCGITPYDTTHLGHAFTYSVFDILIRLLESQNLAVRYTQNVTDIDDDILRKAKQVNTDWQTLGNEWTVHFIEDMRALNVRPPDEYPRATEVIPRIIQLDRELIERELAYESHGNVYFDVDAFKGFGELSHIPRSEMLAVANERGNHPDDPFKRDPLDFVLWQHRAEGEPAWLSPWGEGRPGWHIECTAMVHQFLGPSIDIHGGGADLVFPHHESEIAQSEGATGIFPFARVWMHVGMVRSAGEKMSKSLGNLVMVRDLLKKYSADALRLYMASHHYRESWEYNLAHLDRCAGMAERWRVAAQGASKDPSGGIEPVRLAFHQALENDLDTPTAISVLDQLANKLLEEGYSPAEKAEAQSTLIELAGLLGMRLTLSGVEERVTAGWSRLEAKFQTPALGNK